MHTYRIDDVDGPIFDDDGSQCVAIVDHAERRVIVDRSARSAERDAAIFRAGWAACADHLRSLGVQLPDPAAMMDA